jgi:hypothetical protein
VTGAHHLRGGATAVDEMKIEALRAIGESLRRGGHGTARRKFKKIRKQSSKADEAKFQVLINFVLLPVPGACDISSFSGVYVC